MLEVRGWLILLTLEVLSSGRTELPQSAIIQICLISEFYIHFSLLCFISKRLNAPSRLKVGSTSRELLAQGTIGCP